MKYGLLEHGDIFQKGDEMFYGFGDWKSIPENWIGHPLDRKAEVTINRQNIQFRRALKPQLDRCKELINEAIEFIDVQNEATYECMASNWRKKVKRYYKDFPDAGNKNR